MVYAIILMRAEVGDGKYFFFPPIPQRDSKYSVFLEGSEEDARFYAIRAACLAYSRMCPGDNSRVQV